MKKSKKELKIKTKEGFFTIILESIKGETGYTVRVKGLPEVITEGRNIEEAKKMAREAIEFCVECNEHSTDIKVKRNPQITTSIRV